MKGMGIFILVIIPTVLIKTPAWAENTSDPMLNPAEQYVSKQIENGETADLKDRFPAKTDRIITAGFLKRLLNDRKLKGKSIKIKNARIQKSLSLKDTIISVAVSLQSCIFEEDIKFQEVTFEKYLNMSGTTFEGDANFLEAKFPEKADSSDGSNEAADFSGTKFKGEAIFSRANFSEEANFSGAKFSGKAFLKFTKFKKKADFSNAEFSGEANFSEAKFEAMANFSEAKFASKANFSNVVFVEKTDFTMAGLLGEAYFKNAEFFGEAIFASANFADATYFSEAKFYGDTVFIPAVFTHANKFSKDDFSSKADFFGKADFENAEFFEQVDFSGVKFYGETVFNSAKFNDVADFARVACSGKTEFESVSFRGKSKFKNCKFPPENKINFNNVSGFSFMEMEWVYIPEKYGNKVNKTDNKNSQRRGLKHHLKYNETFFIALIKNYKDMGWLSAADDAYYTFQVKNRKARWLKNNANPDKDDIRSNISRLYEYIKLVFNYSLLDFTFGYGVKPKNLLRTLMLFWIPFAFYYVGFLRTSPGESLPWWQAWNPFYKPSRFAWSLIYSLDTLTPGINFESFDTLGTKVFIKKNNKRVLYVRRFQEALGWYMVALFLIMFSKVWIR